MKLSSRSPVQKFVFAVSGSESKTSIKPVTLPFVALFLLAAMNLNGCSSGTTTTTTTTSTLVSQSYLGPTISNTANTEPLGTYSVDRSAKTFVREGYSQSQGDQPYVLSSGGFSILPQGILNIGLTYLCTNANGCNSTTPGTQPTASPGWGIELPGQAALIQVFNGPLVRPTNSPVPTVINVPFVPLAPATTCPVATTAQPYQFVTIPTQLSSTAHARVWNPVTDTAFGSFSFTTSGNTLTFSNVSQSTLPVAGGNAGKPTNPSAASVSGVCTNTLYGQTISVPGTTAVINPGVGEQVAPTATIAIGPSGFLVEDNGSLSSPSTPTPAYQNLLGSGFGAVGLQQPASQLKASDLIGAQYAGFVYGAGSTSVNAPSTSRIASFGLTGQQSACPTLPAQTGTILYGGEFTNNDPSANAAGNCDIAIDLGTQDSKNNGLYPNAKVYVSGTFPGNNGGQGTAYSFSAVVIAGQLTGKNAILLIGLDTQGTPNQGWGIYLLQSN